jgi:hypothetical protein
VDAASLLPECGIWIQILEYSSVAARFKLDDTLELEVDLAFQIFI